MSNYYNNLFYNYQEFIRNRNEFRRVDKEGINRHDSPASLYFKLVFYFDDNGLLGIPSEVSDDIANITAPFVETEADGDDTSAKSSVLKNTAYNYLLLNDELERAKMLSEFISLLSEINSNSPWYFTELGGLDGALERKMFSDGEVKLEDKPKQITIKCLNDAFDNRIGTLLDLYRAACFSYQSKKEIVPANLRRFNMGVILFNAPLRGQGGKSGDKNAKMVIPEVAGKFGFYIPSVKLIELRNCEIDYNSSKSAYSSINTTEAPFSPEYTISINFDDCYESRYNEVLQGVITDFITIDLGIEDARADDGLNDIDGYGQNPVYTEKGIQIAGGKNYWTDSDISRPMSDYFEHLPKSSILSPRSMEFDKNNVITNQLNKLGRQITETIDKYTTLPMPKNDENIHDYGTVNDLGHYEYLNRMSGMNSAAGIATRQLGGMMMNPLRSKVKQLYLGNLHGFSLGNMMGSADKLISGDFRGAVSDFVDRGSASSSPKPMTSLPGWNEARVRQLAQENRNTSARNNL